MAVAAKIQSSARRLGALAPLEVVRDLFALVGAALAIGLSVSFGLMLMVVGLS